MKSIIFLFALFGLALAYIPGHEYRYSYTGRLAMGMPEIRNKVSGFGMKSEIVLQIIDDNKASIQLTNIKVGEYLGDVPCETHAPLPIKYTPLKGHARELEESFEVHFRNIDEDVMIVPKSDREWMTNLRKSITLLFAGPIFHGQSPRSKRRSSDSSWKNEMAPTLHGMCNLDFTVVPVTDSNDRREQETFIKRMKQDVEKGSSEKVYLMTKSVDFDNCTDRVGLFRAGLTNISLATMGQFADVMSRASVANLTVIGTGQERRIQSGVAQGFITANPTGSRTEKLISVSNQTFDLISVTKFSKPMTLTGPTKVIDSWYMEFASPFAEPSNPEDKAKWVNYYNKEGATYRPLLPETIATGIDLTPEQIKGFADRLDEIISDVADRLTKVGQVPSDEITPWSTNEAEITSVLNSAAKITRGVDMESLQSLFDQYQEDSSSKGSIKQGLLVEILAASGSGAPMKVLLENIKSGKVSNSRIASVFTTLPNHFTWAPAVKDLVEYMKSLDLGENPFLTTLVWVNVAKTLNRICIDKEFSKATSHFYIFGNEQCDSQQVAKDLVRFLSDKIDQAETSWERMVVLETMGNLGTNKSMEKLTEVIHGDFDITVKRAAIYALSSSKMEGSARTDVFNTLMSVIDDLEADTYLRQISITTLLTWRPHASWWQHIAARSWNETSNNVGAFVYQILKDLSVSTEPRFEEAARMAQFVLPMTKPYARSPWYSYTHYFGFRDQQEYLSSDYVHSVVRDERSPYALERFEHIWHNLGGIKFLLAELGISSDLPDGVQDKKSSKYDESSNLVRSMENRRGDKAMGDVLEQIESTLRRNGLMSKLNIWFSAFNNLQFLAPVNKDTISKAFGKDGIRILKKWLAGTEIHLTKYFDPTSMEVIIPAEIGVPFFVRMNTPIVQGADGTTKLRMRGDHSMSHLLKFEDVAVDITTNYKLLTKTIVSFIGLVPWTEKLIASGVDTFKGLNYPGKSTFAVRTKGEVRNLTYEFTPNYENEYPSHHVHTVPFVVRKSMWPGQSHDNFDAFSVIALRDDKRGVTKVNFPISYEHFGLKGHIGYEGDAPFPYTMGNIIEYFYTNPAKLSELLVSPTARLSSSVIAVNFQESEMKTYHASLAFTKPQTKEHTHMISFNALFEGENSRYYEISISNDEEEAERAEFSFKVARNAVPKYNLDSKCYTFNLTTKAPVIEDYENLLNDLKSRQLQVSYNGAVSGGKSCDEQQLATVTGKLNLSEDRKRRLARELKDDCDFDPRNPMVNFRTAAVYDEVTVSVDYTDRIPDYVRNATSHIYDFVRGVSWPHAYFNYVGVNNENNKISAKGSRQLEEGKWDMKIDMPTETAIFDHWRFPYNYDHLISYLGIRPRNAQSQLSSGKLILNSQITNKCVLTKSSVRTFDGKRFSYSPEPCPTVSVMNKRDPRAALLRTEKSASGKLEAQIESTDLSMTIKMRTNLFSVNGQEMRLDSSKKVIKTESGAFFAEARKLPKYVEVLIPGNFSVKLWDEKIEVEPARNMRSQYAGMCGNFNGETRDDFVGPKGCIYSSPSLFAKSWTVDKSEACDRQRFNKEKEEVEEYQKKCPKKDTSSNSSRQMPLFKVKNPSEGDVEVCTQYVYYIKTRYGNICVSQESVARCRFGCKMVKKTISMEVYDCWSEDTAPQILQDNVKIGYIHKKIHDIPTVTTSFRTTSAFICEE